MDYIFTFLGEFGYEFFNWQGVIRKWNNNFRKSDDRVIVCSRKGMHLLYEFSDEYVDISEIVSYKKTTAGGYIAVMELGFGYDEHGCTELNRICVDDIKKDIKELVNSKIELNDPKWVFSCDPQYINGLPFGKTGPGGGSIYDYTVLPHNEYKKIDIPQEDSIKKQIEEKLGFELNDEYILVQTAKRDSFMKIKSRMKLDYTDIIKHLSKKYKIIYLSFDSGRFNDSKSDEDLENVITYQCNTFEEQSVLINNAEANIFFSEGDFRSHLYIPPMIGKDVVIIVAKEVLGLRTSPVDFWNENIYRFGAQMYPIAYDEILDNEENMQQFLMWVDQYFEFKKTSL